MELKKLLGVVLYSVLLWVTGVEASSLQTPQSTLYNYHNSICQQDDFISGIGSSGTLGVLGWFFAGGTATVSSSPSINHLGLFTKNTSAVANTVSYQLLSGSQPQVLSTVPYYVTWIAELNNNDGDTIFRVGMTGGGTVSPTTGSGAYFEKAAADTNWFLVTAVGGVAVRTDSGVAVDTNWHNFKIVHVVSPTDSYAFWLDNVLVGTRTTNLPNTGVQPFTHIVNTTANAKSYNVDYFEWCVTGFARP